MREPGVRVPQVRERSYRGADVGPVNREFARPYLEDAVDSFADDPYGWDGKLGLALGLNPSRRRPARL